MSEFNLSSKIGKMPYLNWFQKDDVRQFIKLLKKEYRVTIGADYEGDIRLFNRMVDKLAGDKLIEKPKEVDYGLISFDSCSHSPRCAECKKEVAK